MSAQFNLGWMYANGQGVPQDDSPGTADPPSRARPKRSSTSYAKGRGVPQE